MAFMLGAFTSGLASGAKNAMDLYGEYESIKSKKDLSDSLTKAMGSSDSKTAPSAGTAPGQATSAVQNGFQSDSAASAPKSTPDLNADPRASTGTSPKAASDAAMSAPGPTGTAPKAASDAAMSAPHNVGQAIATGAQGNPAGDVWPSSTTPTQQAGTAAPTKSQSPWMDWLLGRNPQNRAVHLTSTMGIAGGAGPSNTPMSTSPGGRPYGSSVGDWTSRAPQGQQPQQPATKPPPLAGATTPGTPTLANQQTSMAQAIQTQYGAGGL